MLIKDLKDSRDQAACERAQHSGRKSTEFRSPVTLDAKFMADTALKTHMARSTRNRNKPTLSQMDQKATPGRRTAFDEASNREFQSGTPINVRSDQSGWNVLPRP